MSLDSSLKTAGNLAQHRNVLKRHERLVQLEETKGYKPEQKPALGLPKTSHRKPKTGKK